MVTDRGLAILSSYPCWAYTSMSSGHGPLAATRHLQKIVGGFFVAITLPDIYIKAVFENIILVSYHPLIGSDFFT